LCLYRGPRKAVMIGLLVFFSGLPRAWAEEESHGVLASGVIHNIAPDRKVEKIGGIMQPEPLDTYLKRLFDELFIKMDQMDQRLQKIEASVQHNLTQPPPAISGKTAGTPKKS
jgi:hypothetical protein